MANVFVLVGAFYLFIFLFSVYYIINYGCYIVRVYVIRVQLFPTLVWAGPVQRVRQTSEEGPHFIGSSALPCLTQSALNPATNRRRFIKS